MSCKPSCACKCDMTTCNCWDGIAIEKLVREGETVEKPSNPLLLKNQPKFRCCEHCDPKYCPMGEGHYAPCPGEYKCVQGQVVMDNAA